MPTHSSDMLKLLSIIIEVIRTLKNNDTNNDNAKKKCSWLDCDSLATEEYIYCVIY
jgi:hypothetical protein